MHDIQKVNEFFMKNGKSCRKLDGVRKPKGQTDEINRLDRPWQVEGGAGLLHRA